jgi:hypothetical protein
MAPLQPPQNFKFHRFILQHESTSTIIRSNSQTPDIVPTSFEPPSKASLWISIEKNKNKNIHNQNVSRCLECKFP